jgi:hypothetical protein
MPVLIRYLPVFPIRGRLNNAPKAGIQVFTRLLTPFLLTKTPRCSIVLYIFQILLMRDLAERQVMIMLWIMPMPCKWRIPGS